MPIRKLAIIAGAAAIATAPLAAQASATQTRIAAPVSEAEDLAGMNGIAGAALGVAIGAALIFGLKELTDDDGDDSVSA
ncbi:hypothetical protein [Alteriqipengyuania lutimaris]|uniref:Uncharacterized protein n=1 Tax=Alteriqipengyuania lutimaris TaxID=1538146 RepID=A0A395LGC4_9SPHN|nr:hypothetical protein [Alteriqipengyuania lutimaris]MBB3035341.1 hypothetical protein [Alteriqipengyuania lutimaris]RDS75928.1 hypothetical protein DL238_14725 [Alteriqipengyuania lutimaris]